MPGMGEWLIILVIVLIIFGASKLPQLGHGLGAAIKNFKRASSGDDEIEVSKKKELGGRSALPGGCHARSGSTAWPPRSWVGTSP